MAYTATLSRATTISLTASRTLSLESSRPRWLASGKGAGEKAAGMGVIFIRTRAGKVISLARGRKVHLADTTRETRWYFW